MAAFEFGPFLLDPAKRSLLRDGVPQALPPKAFDVLALLVQCRHRALSKEELLNTLWADTFVEEANLSQQIFVLRRMLNGGSNGVEYIATIPRHGYRFTARVTERSDSEPAASAAQEASSRRYPRLVVACAAAAVLLIAIVAGFARRLTAGPEPRLLVVTSLPGLEQSPSISPDGNFVVFSWTGAAADGRPDLWIKAVDGDALRRLTETPTAEIGPAWSPDGREIAFVRAGQGVFVMSALGGHERQVIGSGSVVGWTPDSRSLLVRDRMGDSPHAIFSIELTTGQRRQLTRPTTGIGDFTFDVSPDGRTLAFVHYERPGVSDVYVAPIEGGEPRRRTNWNAAISSVAWMPGGRDIVYAVNEAPGLAQTLYKVAAGNERVERGVRALHTSLHGVSMSRPGSGRPARIAYTSRRIDIGLRLVDLSGPRPGALFRDVRQFSDSTLVEVPGPFSAGGEQVAFLSDRTGWAEAWIANADGSGLRQATTLHATELLIGGWSPDRHRLVVDADIDGNSDVYVISLDGGPPVRLTTEPGFDGLAEWSSDGRWIYFTSSRSGRSEIWKVPAEGGQAIQLTRNGGVQPREGPDGRTVFYLDRAPPGAGGVSGTSALMQMPLDGGAEAVVLDHVRFGLWAVTDTGIVFLTTEKDADAIDFHGFRDRNVRRLGTLPFRVSRIAGLGGLTVSRDGRWLLASVTDVWESDIMVADGFR